MEFNIKMSGLQISRLCLEQCYFPAFYIVRLRFSASRMPALGWGREYGSWCFFFFFSKGKSVYIWSYYSDYSDYSDYRLMTMILTFARSVFESDVVFFYLSNLCLLIEWFNLLHTPSWFLFWWLLGEGRRCRDSQVFVWVVQGLGQAGAIAAIASLGLFNRGKYNGWNANKRKDAKKKMGGMPKIQPQAFFFLPWEIFPQRWDRPTGTRRKPLEGWGSQKTGWGPSQTSVNDPERGRMEINSSTWGRLMKYLE